MKTTRGGNTKSRHQYFTIVVTVAWSDCIVSSRPPRLLDAPLHWRRGWAARMALPMPNPKGILIPETQSAPGGGGLLRHRRPCDWNRRGDSVLLLLSTHAGLLGCPQFAGPSNQTSLVVLRRITYWFDPTTFLKKDPINQKNTTTHKTSPRPSFARHLPPPAPPPRPRSRGRRAPTRASTGSPATPSPTGPFRDSCISSSSRKYAENEKKRF